MLQLGPLTRCRAVLAAAVVVSFAARSAAAQQPPAPSPEAEPAALPAAPAVEAAPAVAPAAPPPAPAASVTSTSEPPAPEPAVDDHASVVGHWGVGYQGISSLPIATGCCDSNALPQLGTVSAPVIGVRYWFRPTVGVDAGLGLGIQTGTAQPSAYGVAFHAGLPIVLAQGRHTAFEVTPEATVGFTTGKIPAAAASNLESATASGLLLRAGARVGAEVHFGFIGLPELALQATVGLYWRTETWTLDQGGGGSVSASSTLITTSVNDAPWGLFTDTITALYYF